MITNANVDNSLTTVLECPQDKRYIIYTVHFCNTSDSVNENLTIFLNGVGSSGNTIVKDIVIPAGETFVLGSSKKLSNADHYRKKGLSKQSIILDSGESLVATASTGNGENVKAVANYAVLEADTKQLVPPSATPSPTRSSGGPITISGCDCARNPNDKYQRTLYAKALKGTRIFYVRYDGFGGEPHTTSGESLFKLGDCLHYEVNTTTYHNKVVKVEGPVYLGQYTYFKIYLKDEFEQDIPITTYMFVCGSAINNNKTPTQTPSNTSTPTHTPTSSLTPTQTPTHTPTKTVTPTNTTTPSVTPSVSGDPGAPPPPTPPNSQTNTPTQTPTKTITPTNTPTHTPSPTSTPPEAECDPHKDKVTLALDDDKGRTNDLSDLKHTIQLATPRGTNNPIKNRFFVDSDSVDFGNKDFTIEAMFAPKGSGDTVITRWYSREYGNAYNSWHISMLYWPNLTCEFNGLGTITSRTSFESGRKYHIVLQRRGTSFELYVNGVLDRAITLTSNASLIGGSSNPRVSIAHWGFSSNTSGYWVWGTGNDSVSKIRITKGVSRYDVNNINKGYIDFSSRPLSVKS